MRYLGGKPDKIPKHRSGSGCLNVWHCPTPCSPKAVNKIESSGPGPGLRFVPHQKADTAVREGPIRQTIDHFTIYVADDGMIHGRDGDVAF